MPVSLADTSAAQCHQRLSEFTQERTFTLTADPVRTGQEPPFRLGCSVHGCRPNTAMQRWKGTWSIVRCA